MLATIQVQNKNMVMFSEEVKNRYSELEILGTFERFVSDRQHVPLQMEVSFEKDVLRKSEKIKAKDKELGSIAIELCYLKNIYCLLHRALDVRLLNLTKTIIYSLNEDNILVFALISRSLIENAASIACLCEQTLKNLWNIETKCECKDVRGELKGLRKKYERIFHRTNFKSGWLIEKNDSRALIKKYLSKYIDYVVDAYDFITEFVHPCFGGSLVIPSADMGSGMACEYTYTSQQLEVIDRMISISGDIFNCYLSRLLDLFNIALRIDKHIKNTLQPSTTISMLFSGLNPWHEGDGTSKEEAICFKYATNCLEHVQFQEQYIINENIKILEKKRCVGFYNGFKIDAYRTDAGNLYFRMPPLDTE